MQFYWWCFFVLPCSAANSGQCTRPSSQGASSSAPRDIKAIIIGAGPAGLAAALGLSKICSTVYLVEKNPTFEPRGSTFGVMKNGRKALQEIDPTLCNDIEQVGIDLPGGGIMLPWWEMRDALLRKVRQNSDRIQLLVGESVTDIQDRGTLGVVAEFESGLNLTADFLVGADGVHSFVRNWLDLPPAIDTGSRVFRGSLTVTDKSSKALRALLEQGLMPMGQRQFEGMYFIVFNFHSKQPGRLAWVFSTTRQLDESVTPMSLLRQVVTEEDDLRLIQEILDGSDRSHLKPYPATRVVDFSDQVLSRLGGGWGGRSRVALTGDAAHAWYVSSVGSANMSKVCIYSPKKRLTASCLTLVAAR